MSDFRLNVLKEILNSYEKFFIHLMPHPDLIIGSRGLIGEEKKNGLVLVFSSYSYDKLSIDEDSITVNMKFSGSWESLYIPVDAVSAVFNDPVKPEFMFSFKPQNRKNAPKPIEKEEEDDSDDISEDTSASSNNVIQFKRKN
ncbi:ClpXP protease specificity-enhancing factor SspB [Seleniivibrio woodruffii]|uniref:ClpXP protease specificity-enhancing factor SspB n=1 Tax=Seleniivibrio woodruffii TaxID=1078050 RepID=UPI0026F30C26|nr:ClpXP protease specificity-enhancing factor SspB [Seleniivibrio woodruffii]